MQRPWGHARRVLVEQGEQGREGVQGRRQRYREAGLGRWDHGKDLSLWWEEVPRGDPEEGRLRVT